LVSLVIVVVLVAISIPVFLRARSAARATECISNVRQVGGALLSHASENHGKLVALQPGVDRETGKRPPIWTVQLALDGYLWSGEGELPCGTGAWTCPECDFMSHTYGGYGVAEDSVFVYEEKRAIGSDRTGSLRLNQIERPERTWLVGDATQSAGEPKKGWYAIWSQPNRWGSHGPAPRHRGKVNVCLVDGSAVVLAIEEIKKRELTENVVR
jgi:prepilin-type processing-associated H-X9-DG protein